MFQINDTVVYGVHGVCKIENITMKQFMGETKEYYILKPVNDSTTTLYISDERFLKEAERILYDEFQYVLNIKKEDVLPLIFSKIENLW